MVVFVMMLAALIGTSVGVGATKAPLRAGAIQSIVVPRAKRPARGSASAPVVIEAYLSFGNSRSASMAVELERLLQEHSDQVRVVFRHLPASGSMVARLAAAAAEEAHAQNRFWQFYGELFSQPAELKREDVYAAADQVGLDRERLLRALERDVHAGAVQSDVRRARREGFSQAPRLVINGRRVESEVSSVWLQGIVLEEVARAQAAPASPRIPEKPRGGLLDAIDSE